MTTKEKDEETKEAPKEEEAKDAEMKDADKEPEKTEEKPKEPEKPKETEEDAAPDSRAKAKVDINMADATLNVMPTANNKILMSLSEGGFQHLLAGVRANVGIKSGRYMFEARILEQLSSGEAQSRDGHGVAPHPRQLVRIGFSLGDSSLFLSDGASNFGFDSEGCYICDKTRKKISKDKAGRVGRDTVLAVLLNLDSSSPNHNTVSLFKDGVRCCDPIPLPEQFHGKALFPTINYRNTTVQLNLGPDALHELPFKCRLVGDAAKDDVEQSKVSEVKGKCELLLPVGMPGQGYFDWVDSFVAKNPSYVEISERKIMDWAAKSGLWKSKQGNANANVSNDRPDTKFGLASWDDMSAKRVLKAVAPLLKRNYIIPEMQANLLSNERKACLSGYNSDQFNKTATVIMGEPNAEYKATVQELILAAKKAKAEVEKKKKAAEEERKKLLDLKKKKAEEARKAKENAQKKKEGKEDDDDKEEEKDDDVANDESKMDDEPAIELTEEEKGLLYRKTDLPDITEMALSKCYADFSLPESSEGFNKVKFEWQGESDCQAFLKKWILEKKMTQRVENLKPGESFKESLTAWQKSLQEMRKRQNEWKDPQKRKAYLAKKKEEAAKKKEGDEDKGEEDKPMEIDVEELDVFKVEDINDVGNGEPLFAHWVYEDWQLLAARYELHLLLHSFKKDLDDADRPSFGQQHLSFYYNVYFKKSFNLKMYATPKMSDFVDLVKDTLSISDTNSFLQTLLDEDTKIDHFVKLTEEHRRDRQRRADAGDETAQLKFQRPQPPSAPGRAGSGGPTQGHQQQQQRNGGGGGGGGGNRSYGGGGGGGGGYGQQKRPYSSGPPSYSSNKAHRASSYGSYGGGYGGGGGYGRR